MPRGALFLRACFAASEPLLLTDSMRAISFFHLTSQKIGGDLNQFYIRLCGLAAVLVAEQNYCAGNVARGDDRYGDGRVSVNAWRGNERGNAVFEQIAFSSFHNVFQFLREPTVEHFFFGYTRAGNHFISVKNQHRLVGTAVQNLGVLRRQW